MNVWKKGSDMRAVSHVACFEPNGSVNMNKADEEKWWVFTFGCGQPHAGYYVKIRGTFAEAREKMVKKYGIKWAFQRSWEEWEKIVNDPDRWYPLEEELEVIE